jgi:hypothetical protein
VRGRLERRTDTATGANNFFREIGASLGSAVVGTLFTNRLMTRLAEGLSSISSQVKGLHVDSDSITPALVHGLPTTVKTVIIAAYNEALTGLPLSRPARGRRRSAPALRQGAAPRHDQ